MRTIKNFRLSAEPRQTLYMPPRAEVLAVHALDGVPHLSAIVKDGSDHLEPTIVEVLNIGEPIPPTGGLHRGLLGTVLTDGGKTVLHIFILS